MTACTDRSETPGTSAGPRSRSYRRAELAAARRDVPTAERRRAAGRVADLVREAELVSVGDVVGLHVSHDGELDTRPLAAVVAASGAQIVLPVTEAAGAMTFRTWDGADRLEPGRFGIGVPAGGETVPPVALDVAFVPCVGFDHRGNRLGRGGGHYDRAFDMRRHGDPPPLLVGVGFDLQLVEGFEPEPHDVTLDVVVTPGALAWTDGVVGPRFPRQD